MENEWDEMPQNYEWFLSDGTPKIVGRRIKGDDSFDYQNPDDYEWKCNLCGGGIFVGYGERWQDDHLTVACPVCHSDPLVALTLPLGIGGDYRGS